MRDDLKTTADYLSSADLSGDHVWDRLYRWAETTLGIEGQEQLVSLLLKREPHERLGCGYGGEERIREHAWFREIDWDKLLRKELRAPWVPPLAGNRA